MSGYLTPHVLDTALGGPAAGTKIALFKITGETRSLLRALTTNADSHILPASEFEIGSDELVFHAGA